MKRRYSLYLLDILDSIRSIRRYARGLKQRELAKDRMRLQAITREIEIIGEAVGQLPEGLRERHPDIPWKELRRFRNAIVHQYWRVQIDVVWDIITTKLPLLEKQVAAILEQERRREAA